MSVVSPLILLIIGALIDGSHADGMMCYTCNSSTDPTGFCDGTNYGYPPYQECPDWNYGCAIISGRMITITPENLLKLTNGTIRGCVKKMYNGCIRNTQLTDAESPIDYPIFQIVGYACYCFGYGNDKLYCNRFDISLAASIGHLTVSYIIVVSLLALTTARLLNQ